MSKPVDPNENLKKIFEKSGLGSDDIGDMFNSLFSPKTQVVTCRGCGQKNRVRNDKVKQAPRCGKCGIPFPVAK